jgi:HK97 gp10 family phage protein
MAKNSIVTGVKEIDRKLASLEPKIQKKLVRSAVRKAGKLIQKKAKDHLEDNEQSGQTKRGIKVRAMKRSRGKIGITVGTTERSRGKTGSSVFGGAQLEFGTKHMRADPFLRPAGYGSEKEVRQMVIDDILAELRALEK